MSYNVKELPTHSPSPDLQSSVTGQFFPFPDFACVSVKVLSAANSHAVVQAEYFPSQSLSTAAQEHPRYIQKSVIFAKVLQSTQIKATKTILIEYKFPVIQFYMFPHFKNKNSICLTSIEFDKNNTPLAVFRGRCYRNSR